MRGRKAGGMRPCIAFKVPVAQGGPTIYPSFTPAIPSLGGYMVLSNYTECPRSLIHFNIDTDTYAMTCLIPSVLEVVTHFILLYTMGHYFLDTEYLHL